MIGRNEKKFGGNAMYNWLIQWIKFFRPDFEWDEGYRIFTFFSKVKSIF